MEKEQELPPHVFNEGTRGRERESPGWAGGFSLDTQKFTPKPGPAS